MDKQCEATACGGQTREVSRVTGIIGKKSEVLRPANPYVSLSLDRRVYLPAATFLLDKDLSSLGYPRVGTGGYGGVQGGQLGFTR